MKRFGDYAFLLTLFCLALMSPFSVFHCLYEDNPSDGKEKGRKGSFSSHASFVLTTEPVRIPVIRRVGAKNNLPACIDGTADNTNSVFNTGGIITGKSTDSHRNFLVLSSLFGRAPPL